MNLHFFGTNVQPTGEGGTSSITRDEQQPRSSQAVSKRKLRMAFYQSSAFTKETERGQRITSTNEEKKRKWGQQPSTTFSHWVQNYVLQ